MIERKPPPGPGWPGLGLRDAALALGGALAGLAIVTRSELLLVLLGGLFVIITLSVVIQVGSYKLTRKRVFRMAPLQHHFELAGWAETTIVVRFWMIAGVFVVLGLWIFYRGGAADLLGGVAPVR
jgi:phospho-N-acetylmuramoyl-pentapeptide-transferase